MNYISLRHEITSVVESELKKLESSQEISGDRVEEIRKFLKSRFGELHSNELIEARLNELIEKFEELYIPLVSINIQKYISK